MIVCDGKHTKYQPSDEEFCCPKCHAPSGTFIVDYEEEGVHYDCEKNHAGDLLRCTKCGYKMTGSAFAAACARKANMVPCLHCKGTGMVKKEHT